MIMAFSLLSLFLVLLFLRLRFELLSRSRFAGEQREEKKNANHSLSSDQWDACANENSFDGKKRNTRLLAVYAQRISRWRQVSFSLSLSLKVNLKAMILLITRKEIT